MHSILLVEPAFPYPPKSKNHHKFCPVGLLKIGTYHKLKGDKVKLVRGLKSAGFRPDRVLITSSFTYWSQYVHEAASYYHKKYPQAEIEIGGIYASLMKKDCKKRSPFAKVCKGLYRQGAAEKVTVDYSLLPDEVEYQIVHSTRGCPRKCKFCGTWKIEPEFTYKKSLLPEIQSNKLIFYDNNLLMNPYIERILKELAEVKWQGRVVRSECQCGIDGRILSPKLAKLMKAARFVNQRIAWDGDVTEAESVKRQINILSDAGYNPKNIYVFMIYNYELSYEQMLEKLRRCKEWGVQIADCRYRPLNQTFDNYNPRKEQNGKDYYIHPNWSDQKIKAFRRAVREQNICIRHGFQRYIAERERAAQHNKENRRVRAG